jgi:hypothetical protein
MRTFLFDNAADLGFEAHVKHAVCFVQDKEADAGQTDASTLDQIHQTSRRTHCDITACLINQSINQPRLIVLLRNLAINNDDKLKLS